MQKPSADNDRAARGKPDDLPEYVDEQSVEFPRGHSPRPQSQAGSDSEGGGVWDRIKFDLRPQELIAYLDQYVVCQEEAKAVLATKICTHFNRAKYLAQRGAADAADGVGLIKNNVLMVGPTGVGKTYLVKLIAAKLGVPFVKGDATKFSETGYVGGDVEDLIRDLVHEADDDLELAQYGIVYIDEIDKIAGSQNLYGPDVSRTGVQRALLKPMEETEVDLKVPHDPVSQLQAIENYRRTGKREKRAVNTRHILFIMSGAFGDLAQIVKRRLNKKELGFGAAMGEAHPDHDYLKKITSADLVEFGFENEFVGRLPVQVVLEELTAADLHHILQNPNNPVVISKKRDFASYGIDLRFEDAALQALAQQAALLGTGARALVSVMEKATLPFEQHLPSSEITRLLITPEAVADPKAALTHLIADPDDPELTRRFEAAAQAERQALMTKIEERQVLHAEQIEGRLTPARMELIADEYYRVGMSLGAAFSNVLQKLKDIRRFEEEFFVRYELGIRFNEAAEVAILAGSAAEGVSVDTYCQRLSHTLEPGLRLVHEKTGRESFLLNQQAVLDTEDWLRELFKEHYAATLGQSGGASQA